MTACLTIASKSYIDAMAAALRRGGLDAPLGSLRVLAMGDLTQGRNPLDRLNQPAGQTTERRAGDHNADPSDVPDASVPGQTGSSIAAAFGSAASGFGSVGFTGRTDPAPLPALVNVIVPAATLFGWGTAPARAGSWGLLDHLETGSVVTAASQHPRTRWCITLTNEGGEAIAHACSRGQHPWPPKPFAAAPDPESSQQPPASSESQACQHESGRMGTRPTPEQPAMLRDWLRGLNLTFRSIAKGACDHAHAEDHYRPSRTLKHLVRARSATCDAPACDAQAIYTDLDHTVPHPAGLTDECNLGPRCRTHHRCKQAPGWQVEQPEPGVTRWTLPSGRTYVTTPTSYDLS